MSEAVAQIVAQVAGLSQQDRAELARAVLLMLEPEDPGADEAWHRELARRVARIQGGEAVGIPAEEVFAAWRRGKS